MITPDDGGFAIEFPDVAGARSWGQTRDGAMAGGADALASMLSALIDDGEQIPQPSPARGHPW